MNDQDARDARLVAYLDGALSADDARALKAEVAGDPALAARLEALDVDLSGLRTGMDSLLQDAPAMPVARSGSLVQMAAAAVVALALVLGGVLIGSRSGQQAEDWREFAAAYHLLYRPETLAAPVAGDGGVAVVSDALGRDVSALAEIEGLAFRRAQILGWDDQTLVQFAYLDAQGRPVAVCVMEADTVAQGFEDADRHGLSTVTFQNGDLQVLVIGAEGMESVEGLAQLVAARL